MDPNSEQPLCYSISKVPDEETLCLYCNPGFDQWGIHPEQSECTCGNTARYKKVIICKVLMSSPGHELDIRTMTKVMVKTLYDVPCHLIPGMKDEIVYNHFDSNVKFDYIFGLDGGILDEVYTNILKDVTPQFISIDHSFSGKYSKQRYIDFLKQRISQCNVKKLDLPQENGHVSHKKKAKSKKKK